MRENKWFILTCCLLAIISLLQLYESHYDSSIFDGLPVLIGSVIGAALFIIAFFRFFRLKHSLVSVRLTPFYFWLASMAVVAFYDRWLNRVEFAPNFMHLSSGSDSNIDGFTLKKDSRYIYWNGSGLGESRNYGTYVRKDSIITLFPDSPRNAPRQMQLLIRPFSLGSMSAFTQESHVYCVDKNRKIHIFDNGYNIVELATH